MSSRVLQILLSFFGVRKHKFCFFVFSSSRSILDLLLGHRKIRNKRKMEKKIRFIMCRNNEFFRSSIVYNQITCIKTCTIVPFLEHCNFHQSWIFFWDFYGHNMLARCSWTLVKLNFYHKLLLDYSQNCSTIWSKKKFVLEILLNVDLGIPICTKKSNLFLNRENIISLVCSNNGSTYIIVYCYVKRGRKNIYRLLEFYIF